jgi:hydroxymethylglutaryl-CoA lyase
MSIQETYIKITECPRDAMQGIQHFIPTNEKAKYLNQLIKCGFNTIDFGSFVSPQAIPQLADTADVIDLLNFKNSETKLLAIVANFRGAEQASKYNEITYLGYPLSLSETFQQRNTNSSIDRAFETINKIQDLCILTQKQLVVYLSMGFGNPYGDPYSSVTIQKFIDKLDAFEIRNISIADTIGASSPKLIDEVLSKVIFKYPHIDIGVHLHATPENTYDLICATLDAGVRLIDTSINGVGGCPFAKDELVGNVDTSIVLKAIEDKGYKTTIQNEELAYALKLANQLYSMYK